MLIRFLTLIAIGILAGLTAAYASTRADTASDAMFQDAHFRAAHQIARAEFISADQHR